MRKIKYIVIHCSATKEGQLFTVADIDKWHKARGFKYSYKGKSGSIGYHHVVYLDGTIHDGRPVEIAGAHVQEHNEDSIGICYIGGLDIKGNPKDTRTDVQKVALIALIKELKEQYPDAIVCGHRDLSPDKNGNGIIEPFEWMKACPCFNVMDEFK